MPTANEQQIQIAFEKEHMTTVKPTDITKTETADALAELRKLFPKGAIRVEASATDADDPSDCSSYARIVIQRARPASAEYWSSAKSFTGLTVSDCMAQIRKWKESQL